MATTAHPASHRLNLSAPGATPSNPLMSGLSPLAQNLPRLTQETELQKMLADEKMRSEQHRTNYQTLKAEHTSLQDEHVQLQNELKNTIEESRLMQEKYKSLLEQMRKEVTNKQAEIEELKIQTVTPQRMEILRMELADEIEQPYREKYKKLDEELESFRNEYNKLRYEYSFLKSEYEHEKEEHQRVLDELKLQNEAEVTNLRKEREMVISRTQSEGTYDTQRVRTLQRENAQLNLKMKGLLAELEEIRAQRETLGLQSDHVTRLQSKQLTEHAANVRALETERESLKIQVENFQKELSATSDLQNQLTRKVHELEKDNIVLKNRAEEVSHKSKVELTNLKMEMLKERGELERERDRLLGEAEELRNKVDVMKHSIDQQASSLVEKERDAVRRVQAAREEEWQKAHKIENDRLELETRLQETERRRIDDDTARQAEKEKAEERIRAANDAKEALERECLVLKTKQQHYESLVDQLEQERAQNSEMKTRMHRIDLEYNSLVSSEQELTDMVNEHRSQIDSLTKELQLAREDMNNRGHSSEKVLAQHRAAWQDEKANLQKRVDEVEQELAQLHQKLSSSNHAFKKKKKRYFNLARGLKDRCSVLEAKLKEVELERDGLKNSIPADEYNRIKKSLRDLMRRHNDFRVVLLSGGVKQVAIGDMSFASVNNPLDASLPLWNIADQENQHQRELNLLKERLEMLDDKQRQQMEEFQTISMLSPIINKERVEEKTDLDSV